MNQKQKNKISGLYEHQIADLLVREIFTVNRWLCVPNVRTNFIYWEADLLALSLSDWLYEIEIKKWPSDLKFDLRKRKHQWLQHSTYIRGFYYACSKEVYTIACERGFELPDYAGLIFVNNDKTIELVKKCAINKHANKITVENRMWLLNICSQRYWKKRLDLWL